jgi:signal transduction histidine kinase/CheY-like chemotaxis protein
MKSAGSLALVAGLLLAFTYLLVRGAAPDSELHRHTLGALHAVVLNDAALQRDVLKARSGLLQNYDPLVQSAAGLRAATEDLRAAPVAGGAARREIERRHAGLAAAVVAQEELLERFKSDNALLQNSLRYFAFASDRLGGPPSGGEDPVATEVAALASAMLRFTRDPGEDSAAGLDLSLGRLAAVARNATTAEGLTSLVVHGRLIADTLPAVDAAVASLLAAPIVDRALELQTSYLAQHARAEARATLSRVLLYIAAVALLGFLVHLVLRLQAGTRKLQGRLRFETLIADIAAGFVDLPRERLADRITAALGQLGEQLGADRAYVVLPSNSRVGAEKVFRWQREGLADPAPADGISILTELAAEEQKSGRSSRVSNVAAMPHGDERVGLEARGVRSRLRVPMRRDAQQVGSLSFEAVRAARHWGDHDVALLITAGEILAGALERERAVAERDALEADLRHAQRMEAVGTLAGGIAHDFNNILGAIMGYAEMALQSLPRGSGTFAQVSQVLKAGHRARGVIDQILAFSRRGEPDRRPVRMRTICTEAADLLRASLPATISIELHIAPAAEEAVVEGDPARLQLVLINLCTNGAQAMDGQGILKVELGTMEAEGELTLSHGILPAGSYVRLTVTDTGHGIDAVTAERLFEPFFTTRGPGAGTGLGLATTHAIVADHGGAMNLRSRPGEGSVFEAYFARSDLAAAEDESTAVPIPRGRGETVLVVDDERPLVLLGEEMLAALGYEPVGFASGARALAAFSTDPERFDLVITDEVMPEMTGTRLATELHRIRPDLPVLLVTGYGGPPRPDRLRAAGIREVLRKPLALRTIAESAARHLGAKRGDPHPAAPDHAGARAAQPGGRRRRSQA